MIWGLWFGLYKRHNINYGFACGRHWIQIDGKVIAQTSGDDVWMRDEDVKRLIEVLFESKSDSAKERVK